MEAKCRERKHFVKERRVGDGLKELDPREPQQGEQDVSADRGRSSTGRKFICLFGSHDKLKPCSASIRGYVFSNKIKESGRETEKA